MVFFSIGLPSRLAEWCDALIVRLVGDCFGSTEAVSVNGLEELAAAVIRMQSAHLVVGSRQPVPRLQAEILQCGRPFLVALGDPRGALRNLVEQGITDLANATRAVASGCAAMLTINQGAHALVLTSEDARDLPAVAAAIARHFEIPIDADEVAALVEQLPGIEREEADSWSWWDGLSEREQATITGAIDPYIAHFAGDDLERLVWEPELFYLSEEPIGPALVAATRPVDLTGRPRIVVYGPFINLPPGAWSTDVVLGFSAEAAGLSFLVEVFAGAQLAQTRITVTGEQVIETWLSFTIDASIDQPAQIRIWSERSAFDGRLALGYVAINRQATIPDETRERLTNVLRQ
jgi:hypothetical protein